MTNHELFKKLWRPNDIGQAEYRAIYDLLADLYSDPDSDPCGASIIDVIDEVRKHAEGMMDRLGKPCVTDVMLPGCTITLEHGTGTVRYQYDAKEAKGEVVIEHGGWGPIISIPGYPDVNNDGLVMVDLFPASPEWGEHCDEGDDRHPQLVLWLDPDREDPPHTFKLGDLKND